MKRAKSKFKLFRLLGVVLAGMVAVLYGYFNSQGLLDSEFRTLLKERFLGQHSSSDVGAGSNILSTAEVKTCRVKRVFDGDTFSCDISGDGRIQRPWEHVRLLGVDTPESKHSKKNKTGRDEPFALAAKAETERTLKGKTVYLLLDTVPQDRYGRTLAYVYLAPPKEGKMSFNETLIRQGLASVLFFDPNYRFKEKFELSQHEAQRAGMGLWGAKTRAKSGDSPVLQ